jgi:hypothetical protein
MKVIIENLRLCQDCTLAAVNDDYSGLDYYLNEAESLERQKEIVAGLESLGLGLVCGDDTDEFSTRKCDCCGTRLAGERTLFSVIG